MAHDHYQVHQVLFERRILMLMTGLTWLGVVIWLVSVATDYWLVVVAAEPGIPATWAGRNHYFLWSHSGLWKRCVIYRVDDQILPPECSFHRLSNAEDDFMRAEFALCVMALILIFMAAGFSVYSLLHPRYMYKRIAGSLHLLSGALVITVQSMATSHQHLTHGQEEDVASLNATEVYYGYSYLLSWVVWILYLTAGVSFFIGSRKRKMLSYDYETVLA